jgi:hypothetical protein
MQMWTPGPLSGRLVLCAALGIAVATTSARADAQNSKPEPWEATAAERTGPAAVLVGPGQPKADSTTAAAPGADVKSPTDGARAPDSPPPAPQRALGGYSFSDAKRPSPTAESARVASPVRPRRASASRAASTSPRASFPAFVMRPDGSSQLTVTLSQSVEVAEKQVAGRTVYTLRGAHVGRVNDLRPLVANHFASPLLRAELRNVGPNAELTTQLRSAVAARFQVVPSAAGAELVIVFPLAVASQALVVTPTAQQPSAVATPKTLP